MPKKPEVKKKVRTAAEQDVIDRRMAAMRDARGLKKNSPTKDAPTKPVAQPTAAGLGVPGGKKELTRSPDIEALRANHESKRGDIAKAGVLKGVSLKPKTGSAGESWKAPPPVENPAIKEWEFASLADLANLPRHHIPMFMQLLKQHLHKLEGSQAIVKVRFNEHNRFFCETMPIDPLS